MKYARAADVYIPLLQALCGLHCVQHSNHTIIRENQFCNVSFNIRENVYLPSNLKARTLSATR